MASMLDQCEKYSQITVSSSQHKVNNVLDDEESPIFCKNKASFVPAEQITHLVVSNDYLVLVMANNVMCRYDLKKRNSSKLQEIELNRIVPGVKLTGLFLDPTSDHLLISFTTELLYQHQKFLKPKPTSKLRGHEITAVGWHSTAGVIGDPTTKPILLGTSKGIIFEVEISADESIFTSNLELYCKQVFDIGKGCAHTITGLQYHRYGDIYFVIATTVDRFYQFVGNIMSPDDRPLLQMLFNKYLMVPEGFQVILSKLKYSCLQINVKTRSGVPTLGWLTQTGIYFGEIDATNKDNIMTKTKMISFPENPDLPAPLGFVLTEFHMLLLYTHHVTGISTLSEQVVFHDYYNESYGRLVNITKDPTKGTVWVFAEKAVFRYKITDEDRDVWKIYVDKGEYEEAKKYCKTEASRDQVLVKQADELFSTGYYEESAALYAETQSSFEEISLKFLQSSQHQALKRFLKLKLEKLRRADMTQRTMLVLWILELLLSQLGALRTQGKQNTDEYKTIQQELDSFFSLSHVNECVKQNRSAVYDLMASHGDRANLIKLIRSNYDYEKVINHHIQQEEYHEALNVLKLPEVSTELWYVYAPTLIQALPKATLSTIIALEKTLSPTRLLPALVAADTNQASDLIKYLEYCINNCQEQAIHNFLLTLYAQHRPNKLRQYIAMQGDEVTMVNYDIGYAIRVCQEYGHKEACVKLLALQGLWEAAVELALSVDIQIAIQTCSLPHCPLHLARKLWLKIAEHVVKEKNDIRQAMEFLQQCDEIKIEDILPFFSDFVTIDHFKDAICSSLQEYNQHIQDLKEEMEDATKSAEVIRSEIQSFRSKYSVIDSDEGCAACEEQLIQRSFYAFPCSHMFHSDCLISEISPLISESQNQRLQQLQRQLAGELTSTVRDQLKSELDSILASQCVYCGDLMIDLIDKPFIEDADYEKIKKEWE